MKIKLLEILSNRKGDGNEQILQLYNCKSRTNQTNNTIVPDPLHQYPLPG